MRLQQTFKSLVLCNLEQTLLIDSKLVLPALSLSIDQLLIMLVPEELVLEGAHPFVYLSLVFLQEHISHIIILTYLICMTLPFLSLLSSSLSRSMRNNSSYFSCFLPSWIVLNFSDSAFIFCSLVLSSCSLSYSI